MRELIEVSWSELSTARQCPHKHMLSYKERWTGATTSPALLKGTLWHNVLEAHYRSLKYVPGDLASARFDAEYVISQADRAGDGEIAELIQWMYDGYCEMYGADEDWEIVAVEQQMRVPLLTASGQKSRFIFKMQVDLLVRIRSARGDSRLWVVDHKCLDDNSYVPTLENRPNVGEIQPGDRVVGSDGQYVRVVAVHRSQQECYLVRLRNGTELVCSGEHVWPVIKSRPGAGTRGPKLEITTADVANRMSGGAVYRMLPPLATQSAEQSYSVDPYLLGALLGDGGLTRGVSFTKQHATTVGRIMAALPGDSSLHRVDRHASKAPTYYFKGSIVEYVDQLGLLGHDGFSKFIPAQYLIGSFDQRLELLRGLMDTDGSHRKGVPLYQTGSERLAADVCRLVQSLGGVATLWCNRAPRYQGGTGKPNWEVKMRFTRDFPAPYHHEEKIERYTPSHKTLTELLTIESIEPVGVRSCTDLEIESDDRLFVVQGILTHNSGKDLPGDKILDLSDQFGLYIWGLRHIGHPVFGAIWNGARTQRNKTPGQTVESRHGRPLLARTDTELDTIAREAYATARAAWAAGALAPRHPDPDKCRWGCQFVDACLLGRKTDDARERNYLLDTGYVRDMERH